jgi:hypothetical protein
MSTRRAFLRGLAGGARVIEEMERVIASGLPS